MSCENRTSLLFIIVINNTSSTDYPVTAGAYDGSHNGFYDVCVSKLSPSLDSLLASTYIGGSARDSANSLVIGSAGNVYVAGSTSSTDFPVTAGAYDTSFNGEHGWSDNVFISKLTGDLSADIEAPDKFTLGKFISAFFGNDPVNLSTGNFILEGTDINIPGQGQPLEFTRFYNSMDDYKGPLGPGWTHNYNTHLVFNDDDSISVYYADGHVFTFDYAGTSYLPPAGCFETLTPGPDNTYILTFKDQTKYTYNATGQLIGLCDKNGNTTNMTYQSGQIATVTDSSGRSLNFAYDFNNLMQEIIDPANRTVAFTYDNDGNLSTIQDVYGGITQYNYDTQGLTEIINSEDNHIIQNTYDSSSRVTSQTDGQGNITHFSYDPASHQTTRTDPKGYRAIFTYDERHRITNIAYPDNTSESYTYDENNCRTSATDKNGNTVYGNCNSYDPVGNRVTRTKPDGNNINYSYNSNNRLVGITYPNSNQVSFSYDINGNRTKMTDPEGTTLYSYDNLDRLTSVTRDVYSIDYDYDLTSNITGITYPDGLNVSYTYNQLNQLQSVTDAVYTAQFTYDELGNITGEQLPNGVTVSYQYDDNGRLTSLQHINGDTVLTGAEYTLDNVGNRLSVTDEKRRTIRYTYDDLNQLTKVQYPDHDSVTYTYDPVGNRLSAGGTSYTYDSANRLIQKGGIPYGYDAKGNLLSVGESVYYDYDYEDRLVRFNDGNNTYQYTYDGDGNRLTHTVSGAVYASYNYIYDINAGLPNLLAEKDSEGNTNNYLYAGGLYGRTGPEERIFYHANGLGSISMVSDVYGEPLNRYTYDAFGSPRSVSESVYNPFMFAGEPYDPSGLIFLRARYYDPSTGRFLTPDTVRGELNDPLSQNLYVYCGNNPVVYIDPVGAY